MVRSTWRGVEEHDAGKAGTDGSGLRVQILWVAGGNHGCILQQGSVRMDIHEPSLWVGAKLKLEY